MAHAMTKTKAVDRINKLLAKSLGTNNEHEAELFERKARELMLEYELVHSDLVTGDITERTYEAAGRKLLPTWIRDLWVRLSHEMGVKLLWSSGRRLKWYVYGKSSDCDRMIYTAVHLEAEIDRRTAAYLKGIDSRHRNPRQIANSYRLGLAHEVTRRVRAIIRDVSPDKDNPFAMIYADADARREAAAEYVVEFVDCVEESDRQRKVYADAYDAGTKEAHEIQINKAMGSREAERGYLLS